MDLITWWYRVGTPITIAILFAALVGVGMHGLWTSNDVKALQVTVGELQKKVTSPEKTTPLPTVSPPTTPQPKTTPTTPPVAAPVPAPDSPPAAVPLKPTKKHKPKSEPKTDASDHPWRAPWN